MGTCNAVISGYEHSHGVKVFPAMFSRQLDSFFQYSKNRRTEYYLNVTILISALTDGIRFGQQQLIARYSV